MWLGRRTARREGNRRWIRSCTSPSSRRRWSSDGTWRASGRRSGRSRRAAGYGGHRPQAEAPPAQEAVARTQEPAGTCDPSVAVPAGSLREVWRSCRVRARYPSSASDASSQGGLELVEVGARLRDLLLLRLEREVIGRGDIGHLGFEPLDARALRGDAPLEGGDLLAQALALGVGELGRVIGSLRGPCALRTLSAVAGCARMPLAALVRVPARRTPRAAGTRPRRPARAAGARR